MLVYGRDGWWVVSFYSAYVPRLMGLMYITNRSTGVYDGLPTEHDQS